MSSFQNDSIFWIEVDKIKPNPFQPRKEFSEEKLNYLAESIRQYGVLQPLVVTRKEIEKPDGGLVSEYELIAGERRLRASKIAGLSQVPAIIRTESEDEGMKLELAIIENLQREDLNPIDRARAFEQLVTDFGLKHIEIAKKMGKSREYVSNSLRLLSLPEDIKEAIGSSLITEGHARPLMMLRDKPEEQSTLFKEILYKKLTVRDAEAIAKKIAYDKVRRKITPPDPEMLELEKKISESLGTRVQIEKKEVGGKMTIDFFSNEDLKKILNLVYSNKKKSPTEMLDNYIQSDNLEGESPLEQIVEDVSPKEEGGIFSKEEYMGEEEDGEGIEEVDSSQLTDDSHNEENKGEEIQVERQGGEEKLEVDENKIGDADENENKKNLTEDIDREKIETERSSFEGNNADFLGDKEVFVEDRFLAGDKSGDVVGFSEKVDINENKILRQEDKVSSQDNIILPKDDDINLSERRDGGFEDEIKEVVENKGFEKDNDENMRKNEENLKNT